VTTCMVRAECISIPKHKSDSALWVLAALYCKMATLGCCRPGGNSD
jgi:hypothetical protein